MTDLSHKIKEIKQIKPFKSVNTRSILTNMCHVYIQIDLKDMNYPILD